MSTVTPAPVRAGAAPVTSAAVRRLAERLGGSAFHREDSGYAAAAAPAFANLEVPWEPEVVVHPAGVADVMAATRWAGEHGLRVTSRAGGVGWHGAGPGTLLLDLRALDGVWVDPARRTVRVQGGAVWRDVHRELAPFGLAAAGPQFPRLGVAGHVLGGGHGWLSCKVGWASDTLLAADVVTADGRLIHVDAGSEPDLLWALRGAGHDFGVVVGLELSLMALERVSMGSIWFAPDRLVDAMAHYREWVVGAPDELSTIVSVACAPAGLPVAPELRGRPLAHVLLCHCGTPAQAAADLAPLRAFGEIVADTVRELPWPELAMGNDVFGGGVHRRSQMRYVNGLSDDVLALTEERCRSLAPLSFTGTHYYGGAMQRVDEHATAMSHRDQPWNYMVSATWTPMEDGAPLRAWLDGYLAELAAFSSNAFYVNYLFDEPEHLPAAYNERTWERLRALRHLWDPTGVFAATNG